MSDLKGLLGPMRVPFLVLPPACVALGLGTAVWTSGGVSALHVVLVLIGALASHVSVNSFNEYFDFKSGLDFKTQRTPFSGGSGTLPANPKLAGQALATAVVSLLIVCAVGVYFLRERGIGILPIGLAGILIVILYTPWIARKALLCLVAPGLGFGTLWVIGTHYALTGEYSWTAFVASLVPFFLVSNLLLLNQFPDVEADRSVGRKNFPVVIGRRPSSLIYGAFTLLAFLSVVVGVGFGVLPRASLLGLAALAAAVPSVLGAYRFADDMQRLAPAMGLNVIVNIAMPVLVAIGLLIG